MGHFLKRLGTTGLKHWT